MSTLRRGPGENWGTIVCVSHHPAGLWPQEWKIFKWLWCPGSGWTALMAGKHLRAYLPPSCSPYQLFLPLLSWRVNDKARVVCVSLLDSCTRGIFFFFFTILYRVWEAGDSDTSAGFMWEQVRAWGRWQQLLSANLPVDIVALLADRQPGLVGGQIPSLSRLSFPIKPFHLNVQSTPWQALKNSPE